MLRFQAQRFQIDGGIFPDLVVNEALKTLA
jgi:hypothetical protein